MPLSVSCAQADDLMLDTLMDERLSVKWRYHSLHEVVWYNRGATVSCLLFATRLQRGKRESGTQPGRLIRQPRGSRRLHACGTHSAYACAWTTVSAHVHSSANNTSLDHVQPHFDYHFPFTSSPEVLASRSKPRHTTTTGHARASRRMHPQLCNHFLLL